MWSEEKNIWVFEMRGIVFLIYWDYHCVAGCLGLAAQHSWHESPYLCLCHSMQGLTLLTVVIDLGIFFTIQKNLDGFFPLWKEWT